MDFVAGVAPIITSTDPRDFFHENVQPLAVLMDENTEASGSATDRSVCPMGWSSCGASIIVTIAGAKVAFGSIYDAVDRIVIESRCPPRQRLGGSV